MPILNRKERSGVCNNETTTEIQIGQGETKSLTFKITTAEFVSSDTLLFAMKSSGYDKKIVKKFSQSVSELTLEEGVYSFIVTFSGEETANLPVGAYYYDLTLIDEYGEKEQLMKPRALSIVPTVGASIAEG